MKKDLKLRFEQAIDLQKDYKNAKVGDTVELRYRAISVDVANTETRYAVSFSEDVLRASVSKLVGKPVQLDHDTSVLRTVGKVASAEFVGASGDFPAGINVTLSVVVDDDLINLMKIDMPNAVSVGLRFKWKPSHTFEGDYEFYEKLGTIHNGMQVTRQATEILEYSEISFVTEPAIPTAVKLKEDGTPFKEYIGYRSVAAFSKGENLLGFSDEELIAKMKAYELLKSQATALSTEKEELKAKFDVLSLELQEAKAQNETLKSRVSDFELFLKDERESIKSIAALALKSPLQGAMLENVEKAGYALLKEMREMYSKMLPTTPISVVEPPDAKGGQNVDSTLDNIEIFQNVTTKTK